MVDDVAEANKSSDPLGALMERRKYKGQSFASAFREARKSGDKTFFWNGKRYTTDLASEKAMPSADKSSGAYRSRRAPEEDFGREGRRTPREPIVEETKSVDVPPRRPEFKLSDVERPGTRVRYDNTDTEDMTYKKGGSVRGGGCEQRGKTRGRMV